MPIYEYQCDGCQDVFEVFQKHDDPPPASHSCGSDKVHRILSRSSFVLKGTGWYATDYAQKPAPKTSSEAGPKNGNDTKTEASADKKEKSADKKGEAIKPGESRSQTPAAASKSTPSGSGKKAVN